MDSPRCANAIAGPIQVIGGKFMLDPATFAAAPEIGMEPGMGFYAIGRFGFLGAITAEESQNHFYFVEPATWKTIWDESIDVVAPEAAAAKFLECCSNWGRANLTSENGIEEPWLETFTRLGAKVVDGADESYASKAPLFWELRKQERPEDLPGLANLLAHILRELRASHHITAVKEKGMSPLDAILAGPGGEENAKMFQFSEPFPEVTDEKRSLREEIETLTNELSAQDLEVLTEDERQELAAAVQNISESLK